ncbi:unnamed protein product [Clonostachys rosea]|uniref:F-box domain-containing protein n=1 Tax=Bionectria ochroleuca TaxID=29856 RepID=A0ABY6U565_BIOOC|nr:unnamed protein product [Clonostachys rosea]
MESTCALCGVCICWESPERWLREFRAIYTHNRNWGDIKLSGIGIATEEEYAAICPEDPDKKHDDEDLADDDTLFIGLGGANLRDPSRSGLQGPEFTGFGIHSACWELLTRLFQPDPELLFHACLSMPIGIWDILDWGHDYDGAAFYSKGPVPEIGCYGPNRLARREDAAIFRSNPLNIPSLQRALRSIHQLETPPSRLPPPKDSSDIFNSLPTEILDFIIMSLPSTDVSHLREASRRFATLHLPEVFWASRFDRGHEFHHIFETLEHRPKSWQALYIMLRILDPSVPALQNRRRIWNLALRLQSLHDQMADVPCQGQPRATFFEPEGIQDEDQKQWSTSGRAVRPRTILSFPSGCLPLRSRQVTWVGPLKVTHLMLSFISINDTRYISGLRFVKEHDGYDCLGYIHPATEEPISLPQPAEIREWCFGLDLRGIKAISLKTEDGWSSPWYTFPFTTCFFGEAENPTPSTLIQVVAYTYDMFTLAGLEFIHTDDSKNVLLGRRGPFNNMPGNRVYENSEDRRLPFSIDGPGGERITGMQVEESWGNVRGIKLETSYNRVIGYGPESSRRNRENWVTVKPCGSLVVGIFAQCGNTLLNFGLLSIDKIDQMVER